MTTDQTQADDKSFPSLGEAAVTFVQFASEMQRGVAGAKALTAETLKRVVSQEKAQADLVKQLGAMNESLETLSRRQDCLEQLSKECRMLSEDGLNNRFTEPMARQLFPVVDLLDDALACVPGNGGDDSNAELLRGIEALVFDFLAIYDIEPIKSGAVFDAHLMQQVKTLPALDKSMHKRVAKSLRRGFRRGERILRHESVIVFRSDEASASN